LDIIVVDNNSSDGTVSFIQKNFPEITLLQQDRNLGFGAANNIGISYALKNEADYVFLLNQDAYLEPDTIDQLIKSHNDHQYFGILSPVHLNGDGTKIDFNFSKYMALNKKLQNDSLKKEFSQQIYEVPFVNAAAWLLPRTTIERIGGFDPIFHHYGEDDNYCQRVLYHKMKIGVVHETYVLHDRKNGSKTLKSKAEKLKHFERGLKQRWANINVDIDNGIRIKKQIIIKSVLKSLLRLKFNEALLNMNKFQLLNHILPDIRNSRKKNKEVGLHYLEE
jgi:GT2 family glycosyltransferase